MRKSFNLKQILFLKHYDKFNEINRQVYIPWVCIWRKSENISKNDERSFTHLIFEIHRYLLKCSFLLFQGY